MAHVYDGCAELPPYGQELTNVGLGIRVVAFTPRGVVESLLHVDHEQGWKRHVPDRTWRQHQAVAFSFMGGCVQFFSVWR